jgi:hypothetical protein
MRVVSVLASVLFLSSVRGWETIDPNSAEVQPLAQWAWKQIAVEWVDNINLDKDAKNLKTVQASKQSLTGGDEEYKLELTGTFSYGYVGDFDYDLKKAANGDLSKVYSDVEFKGDFLFDPMNTESAQVQKVEAFIWKTVSQKDARVDLQKGTNLEIVNAKVRDMSFAHHFVDYEYIMQVSGEFNGDQIDVTADVEHNRDSTLNMLSYNVSTVHQIQ